MKELRETIHNATLTKTQKLIAKYVLDNSADACFMTSTDIADTLGVSESSVVRFSRSLGYSGFMEFQKSLRKDYQDKVLSISSSITVPSQRVAKQAKLETNSDYIKRHYKNTTKNLDTIFSQNATSAFDEQQTQIYRCIPRQCMSGRLFPSVPEAYGTRSGKHFFRFHQPD